MGMLALLVVLFLLKFNDPSPYLNYAIGLCFLLCLISVGVCIYIRKNLVLDVQVAEPRIREGDLLRFTVRVDYPELRARLVPVIRIVILQTGEAAAVPSAAFDGSTASYEIPGLPAGTAEIRIERVRVYGLFGLFFLPKRDAWQRQVRIDPAPRPVREQYIRKQYLPGDGEIRNAKGDDYSELYEVRPFREGDDLRYVHRTLTAKHGDYIIKVGSDSRKPHYIYRLPETDDFTVLRPVLGELVTLRSGLLGEENCCISALYRGRYEEISVDSRFSAFIERAYQDYVR